MICAVYKIKNLVNNKVYIGSTVNTKNREYKHFWMLNKGIHDNEHLQKSFNKYGSKNFVFEIVETCEEKDLFIKENYYIEFFKSNTFECGYNLATTNHFRRNNYNNEVKVKLSKKNLETNGNFIKFKLISLVNNTSHTFDSLVEAANYIISNGYSKATPRNVRMKLSNSLRGKKVNNGYNGSIRKTCYKHKFEIIN